MDRIRSTASIASVILVPLVMGALLVSPTSAQDAGTFVNQFEEDLNELETELNELENAVAADKDAPFGQATLGDLQGRLDSLQERFDQLAAADPAAAEEQHAEISADYRLLEEDIERYGLTLFADPELFVQEVDVALGEIDNELNELEQMVRAAPAPVAEDFADEIEHLNAEQAEIRTLAEEMEGITTPDQFQTRKEELADEIAELDGEITSVRQNLAIQLTGPTADAGI